MTTYTPPPVAGYQPIPQARLDAVNANKRAEEELLRALDARLNDPDVDQRWLAIARTHIQQGYMAFNRAILQPQRIKLDGDE